MTSWLSFFFFFFSMPWFEFCNLSYWLLLLTADDVMETVMSVLFKKLGEWVVMKYSPHTLCRPEVVSHWPLLSPSTWAEVLTSAFLCLYVTHNSHFDESGARVYICTCVKYIHTHVHTYTCSLLRPWYLKSLNAYVYVLCFSACALYSGRRTKDFLNRNARTPELSRHIS